MPFHLGLCFRSRRVFHLPTCLPPSHASSASRLIFRLQTCPPRHLPLWSCLPPAFLQHPLAAETSTAIPQYSAMSRPVRSASPPWHLPHRYTFRCTAARSGHTASLPPLCRIFRLHHCISHCSALPTCHMMSRDVT